MILLVLTKGSHRGNLLSTHQDHQGFLTFITHTDNVLLFVLCKTKQVLYHQIMSQPPSPPHIFIIYLTDGMDNWLK